jgi:hypothetical protein
MADCSLPLTVQELPGRVRLWRGGLAHGDGPTLQDAAEDLVQRLLTYAMAVRASGFRVSPELGPPELAAMNLLYELGEIAAGGATSAAACAADDRTTTSRSTRPACMELRRPRLAGRVSPGRPDVMLDVIPPAATGPHWSALAGRPSDVTCKDSTRQYPVDGCPLPCKQPVAGRCLVPCCQSVY